MKFITNIIVLVSAVMLPQISFAQPTAQEIERIDITYDVKKLYGLNTDASEFSPVVKGNDLYFTSSREYNLLNYGEGNWEASKYMNIFVTHILPIKDSITFSKTKPLSLNFHSGEHIGPLTFTPDGKTVYYSKTKRSKKGIARPKIYTASVTDEGEWTDEAVLAFCSDDAYSYGHPAISADGQTLYFASDMNGGKGGKDIWMVQKTGGNWGQPNNLNAINTNGDDMFPYVMKEELYFASNGHPGEGGLDLFKTLVTEWKPENLGNTINTPQDDFGISFNVNENTGYFTSNRADDHAEDNIYFFKMIKTVVIRTQDLTGQFRYRALGRDYAEGVEVLLVDEDGNLVMKTRTDANGNFAFRELPMDHDYAIKLASNDDVELIILDENGEPTGYLKRNANGEFVYRQLPFEQVSTLTLVDESDIDLATNTGKLSGQFIYEELARDYPGGMNVYLVDEDGKIVFRTKTDANGNFEFRELPLDKNYIVKTDEDTKDYTLLIFNKNGDVVAQLKGDKTGTFIYRQLDLDNTRPLRLADETDESVDFLKRSNVVFGRFHYEELDRDFADRLNVHVMDEAGNLIFKGKTDKQGYFRFTSLPMDEGYTFVLVDNDPDPELTAPVLLTIYDRDGKPVGMVPNKGSSTYHYRELERYEEQVVVDVSDVDVLLEIKSKKLPMIYYERNSSYLEDVSAEKLRQIAQIMNENPELTLEIASHTDAKASDEYNMELSKKRTEGVIAYLKRKGISEDRLKGTWHGETKLLNRCKNGVKCGDEEHRENRRTEFVFN